MIRSLEPKDIEELKEIHDKFFKHEFAFPDFFRGFLCCFAVTDDSDNSIIVAAGIRPIAEVYAITDKNKSTRKKRDGLYKILEASAYIANANGFNQLHCFVQDDAWEKQLIKKGFSYTKGKSLVYNI
jgi:hypothetical protein